MPPGNGHVLMSVDVSFENLYVKTYHIIHYST